MKRKQCLSTLLILCAAMVLAPICAQAKEPMAVMPLYQEDYTDVLFVWKGEGKSVATSGCGAVCMSMVLSYYFPEEPETDPESLMKLSFSEGLYKGNGLSINSIVTILEGWGLKCKSVNGDEDVIHRALNQNKLIIAYMGAGTFSSGGHYILLYGYDDGGRVWVIDPNSRTLSETHYALNKLFKEAGSEHAFLICSVSEGAAK